MKFHATFCRIASDCTKLRLISLLGDEDVTGHAIMALGKLKSKKARQSIERFVSHPKAWVRKEAKRALTKIDKGRAVEVGLSEAKPNAMP